MRLDLSAIEAKAAESPLCGYGCRHVPALVAEVRRYRNGACEVCWNNAWVPTEEGSRCDYCWVRGQLLAAEERCQTCAADRDRITSLLHQSNVDCLAERERARLLRGDVQLQLARTEAERDRVTLDLHSARQMVTDTHAALERSEALAARLQAGWDDNAQIGAQALADLRRVYEGIPTMGALITEAFAERDAALARAAELESLIADHEFEAEEYDTLAGRRISICPVCGGHGGHHTHGLNQPCPWGQAAANHRARQAEVQDAV